MLAQDRLVEMLLPQGRDRILEGADARQHDLLGRVDLLRLGNHPGCMPHLLERLLHRAKIGHAVIDDGDAHERIVGAASERIMRAENVRAENVKT